MLSVFLPEFASVTTILAVLGFDYATIGLANSSRTRWEDVVLTAPPVDGAEARDQAAARALQDFHSWYGVTFVVSIVAVILTLVLWGCAGCTGLLNAHGLGLALLSLTLALGLLFCCHTYQHELTVMESIASQLPATQKLTTAPNTRAYGLVSVFRALVDKEP